MRVRALWLTLAVVIAGQATCATGIEPPRATDLVEVTDGLTFEFGQEAICWNRAEMLGPNKDLEPGNCDDGKYIPFIPPTTEVVLKPFAIEQHEVSNFQYEYCVAMGACTPPSGYNAPGPRQQDYYEIDEFDDHPVMFVSKFQAQEYCAFVGRRLPTELEWDRVARGNPNVVAGGKRLVPTDAFSSLEACKGQDVAGTFCGQSADTVPVDQPGDDYVMEGDYMIHHLFSNVAEWTADAYDILRTCKDAMPAECTSVFECNDLVGKTRLDCQQAANICQPCDNYDTSVEYCHEGCADGSRSYYTCVTWGPDSLPVEASQLKTGADNFGAVRGGSVTTSDDRSCHFYSDYRGSTIQKKTDTGLSALGFRCAVDL